MSIEQNDFAPRSKQRYLTIVGNTDASERLIVRDTSVSGYVVAIESDHETFLDSDDVRALIHALQKALLERTE